MVSVIIPTLPERAKFLELAKECISRQDYPRDRVEILDDKEVCSSVVKRNRMCERAKGEYIFLQDDDDWSGPSRISTQVEYLEKYPHKLICGLAHHYVYDLRQKGAVLHQRVDAKCCTIALKKSAWNEHRFVEYSRLPEKNARVKVSCGTCAFLHHFYSRTLPIKETNLMVLMLHGENASGANLIPQAQNDSTEAVTKLVGEDILSRYHAAMEALR